MKVVFIVFSLLLSINVLADNKMRCTGPGILTNTGSKVDFDLELTVNGENVSVTLNAPGSRAWVLNKENVQYGVEGTRYNAPGDFILQVNKNGLGAMEIFSFTEPASSNKLGCK